MLLPQHTCLNHWRFNHMSLFCLLVSSSSLCHVRWEKYGRLLRTFSLQTVPTFEAFRSFMSFRNILHNHIIFGTLSSISSLFMHIVCVCHGVIHLLMLVFLVWLTVFFICSLSWTFSLHPHRKIYYYSHDIENHIITYFICISIYL